MNLFFTSVRLRIESKFTILPQKVYFRSYNSIRKLDNFFTLFWLNYSSFCKQVSGNASIKESVHFLKKYNTLKQQCSTRVFTNLFLFLNFELVISLHIIKGIKIP